MSRSSSGAKSRTRTGGRTAFGADGEPADPETGIRLQVMLDDLAWWSSALGQARAAGELPPGSLRARAALAAVQS